MTTEKTSPLEERSPLHAQLTTLTGFVSKQPGYAYSSLYEFFLQKGSAMPIGTPSAKTLKMIKQALKALDPKQKECFYNAQRLALNYPNFRYCEGYVLNRLGLTIHHAWALVDHTKLSPGIVFDPTLRIDHRKSATLDNLVVGIPPVGWEYWGKTFPTKEIFKLWDDTGNAGSMIDRPDNNWAALKAG